VVVDETIDTSGAILACAATLLRHRTFEDITYLDLAEASGVSERTIYRRFPTRRSTSGSPSSTRSRSSGKPCGVALPRMPRSRPLLSWRPGVPHFPRWATSRLRR